MFTELELDKYFWEAFSTNEQFQKALLDHTKFKGFVLTVKTDELWHQRWYRNPETKKDSETDITLFLEDVARQKLYSIHIENKPPHRAWEERQAESYRPRSEYLAKKWKHEDCTVGLIATANYLSSHVREVNYFEFTMTYEEIGLYVPQFAKVSEKST